MGEPLEGMSVETFDMKSKIFNDSCELVLSGNNADEDIAEKLRRFVIPRECSRFAHMSSAAFA